MNTPEAVDAGMAAFAQIKAGILELEPHFDTLEAVFKAIRDEGDMGKLECKALVCRSRLILDTFRAGVFDLHSHTTLRAQAKGIDIPQPLGGGDR